MHALPCLSTGNRDLKPSNILFVKKKERDGTETIAIKVGDFGSSRYFEDLKAWHTMLMTIQGTLYFMAPEVKKALDDGLKEAPFKNKADIYSAMLCVLMLFVKTLS